MFWQLINRFFNIVLFFVIPKIGLVKKGSSLFYKKMNLKIELPPYEQIRWDYNYKTLG